MTLEEMYHDHMKEYYRAHMVSSSMHHPNDVNYKVMLAMGKPLIPYLLKDLINYNERTVSIDWDIDYWGVMSLLWELTGNKHNDLIDVDDKQWNIYYAGRFERQRSLWINWGVDYGYLSESYRVEEFKPISFKSWFYSVWFWLKK